MAKGKIDEGDEVELCATAANSLVIAGVELI
jgi:hypothetical protein